MQPKTILLVEDNADDAELTMLALRQGHVENEVVHVEDGVLALDYLMGTGDHAAAPPPLPEIVLLDLKLPRLDGIEVLRQVRASDRTRLLPVVVLTSSLEERDLLQCYSLGANSYVRKPVDFDEFMRAAQQLGQYWLVLNQRVH